MILCIYCTYMYINTNRVIVTKWGNFGGDGNWGIIPIAGRTITTIFRLVITMLQPDLLKSLLNRHEQLENRDRGTYLSVICQWTSMLDAPLQLQEKTTRQSSYPIAVAGVETCIIHMATDHNSWFR